LKVLVTGAGGFLGVHVVERLLAHGQTDIRCFLRDRGKARRLLELVESYPSSQLELCYGNLRSKSDCARATADVSVVFHLAAGLKGAPAELFADSVASSRNLLEALEGRQDISLQSTRVVLVSSFGVYGVVPLGRGARVNEETPLESHPELRDTYSHSKLRQEQLFWDFQRKDHFELVVLRPGVIYGPGGGPFSNRVGLQIGPVFFHLGGSNLLPLSYVENCAEAIVVAGIHPDSAGQVYNLHDDELPTASQYLRAYKKGVKKVRSIRLPYFVTRMLAWTLETYHRRSQGQLPAIITRYKAAAAWGGNKFGNAKVHSLGWRQLVTTRDGMAATFDFLRAQNATVASTGATPRSDSETIGAVIPAAIDLEKNICEDSQQQKEKKTIMAYPRVLFVSVLGVGAIITGFLYHDHIARVKAAWLEHITPPAPYFPPGAVWTQDISHASVDPQSATMISWLADAGGWGHGRMQVDFGLRVLQASPSTPMVTFHKGPAFMAADSDKVSVFPMPVGGGIEAQPGYQCDIDQDDCHLLVVDRSHGKLYEAYQANYADNALSANFVAVWDLNRVYPPSGRGDQCTSGDAAGFPIAPLVFSADEIALGSINHAIRFTLPNPRIRAHVFVHPATHAGAPRGPVSAPPMGARFRLKSSFDMSKLTPAAQVVARAMQKYGIFLSDGGNIALTAQNDADTKAKYTDMDFGPHDLQDIKVTDFEIVNMGTPIRLTDDCVLNR
jgi:nucleoside-diphosphate-sugar epimerase